MPSKRAIFSTLLIFASCSIHADGFDVQRYQSFMSLNSAEKEKNIAYLIGVSRGITLASTAVENNRNAKLFCIPENKFQEAYGGLIPELNTEIASPRNGRPYAPDTPIEIVMFQVFQNHYPCGNQ